MAFQFGTNWSVLAQKTGSIQGPLLGYETFTAFLLEATFFGVMLLGRERVFAALPPGGRSENS
jgi:cytochrome bd ubiquinol oxidase subunit I